MGTICQRYMYGLKFSPNRVTRLGLDLPEGLKRGILRALHKEGRAMRKLLEDLWSFFALAMTLIGLGGLAFHTFKTDGWLSQLTGRALDAGISAIPVIIVAIVLAWACLSGRLVVGKKGSKFGDMLVLALIFTGIYFTYSWLSAEL